MKKPGLLFSVFLLAGCGIVPQNDQPDSVRTPDLLRAEQRIPLSFAQIQMALFRHKAACGSGPVFSADSRNASYASVTQKLTEEGGPKHTIVVDLVLLEGRPVKAQAYSYYAGVDKQIQRVFNAITHPEVCG
ncbi:MAG: hypothetical protein ABI228_00645 [Burkholderiaceae bacterium]